MSSILSNILIISIILGRKKIKALRREQKIKFNVAQHRYRVIDIRSVHARNTVNINHSHQDVAGILHGKTGTRTIRDCFNLGSKYYDLLVQKFSV